MARIIRKETRQRGFFGWVFLLLFIGFNLLMVWSLFSGLAAIGNSPVGASDAEQAGKAIGTVIGTGMLLAFWACGDVILGLFVLLTRGRKMIIEETVA